MKFIVAVLCFVVAYVAAAPTDSTSSSAIFNVILGDEEQTITVNEEENIEIYRTSHSDDAIIIKDFNRRLEVIAPKGGEKCFVRPLRASKNVEPSKLKRNLENDTEQVCEIYHMFLHIP
ncbi:uncharacterized protein LOC102808517 [Saccoglossus kowalevskii]|uniref:Uncharacterized protein LOC102808517 n=1 Tax=Saccoglossus kowalevskii TaxID=10224 RepID=A0ABM0M351_SACKO|nr:PREDICTED: uncharacterized protein LOC102808517 [Saccoglossus kowalevskii]